MSMPPRLTAATGLDALSHCIEGFLSKSFCPPADAMALDGIRRVFRYLPLATADGSNFEARMQMMIAAFEGGVAIRQGSWSCPRDCNLVRRPGTSSRHAECHWCRGQFAAYGDPTTRASARLAEANESKPRAKRRRRCQEH